MHRPQKCKEHVEAYLRYAIVYYIYIYNINVGPKYQYCLRPLRYMRLKADSDFDSALLDACFAWPVFAHA